MRTKIIYIWQLHIRQRLCLFNSKKKPLLQIQSIQLALVQWSLRQRYKNHAIIKKCLKYTFYFIFLLYLAVCATWRFKPSCLQKKLKWRMIKLIKELKQGLNMTNIINKISNWQDTRTPWIIMVIISAGLVVTSHSFFQNYLYMRPCE